jgi:hypothetical protein
MPSKLRDRRRIVIRDPRPPDTEKCVICQEEIPIDQLFEALCGHRFCPEEIQKVEELCPVCRAPLNLTLNTISLLEHVLNQSVLCDVEGARRFLLVDDEPSFDLVYTRFLATAGPKDGPVIWAQLQRNQEHFLQWEPSENVPVWVIACRQLAPECTWEQFMFTGTAYAEFTKALFGNYAGWLHRSYTMAIQNLLSRVTRRPETLGDVLLDMVRVTGDFLEQELCDLSEVTECERVLRATKAIRSAYNRLAFLIARQKVEREAFPMDLIALYGNEFDEEYDDEIDGPNMSD